MASLIRILNSSPTEQAHQSEAASPNNPEQPEEPARPNGGAPLTAPMSPGGPTLMGNSNSLPDRSGHGVSTSEPQSNTTDAKQLVHYNGQNWEYESFEWLQPGILSLNLKPVGSNGANELVREAYIQSDNPDQLLRLWNAIPRPVYTPDPTLYEIFAVLRHKEFKNDEGEKAILLQVQWTGFSKKDTSWEAEAYVKRVASDVLNEYWSKRAKGSAKITKRAKGSAKISKWARLQRQATQQR
ncbi:Chromo domain-like protein [Cordyceps fumosorosea ARSEF 2679]|uniref:Chromo domain-like protein n=1 Tax=Cordyceps fumosorosea (strain ARSEF 2679) TaxID=1081104 RepID=A0A166YE48_CORFA|nr:Chromo domain-like protein [Cordyceps fumosorosea ARSEF 2679]OAA36806.1 Chromo domain-like protein [Cordyceps fumosorosea ARSEF 2679]